MKDMTTVAFTDSAVRIGATVQALRKARGLDVACLASRCGLAVETLRRLERGGERFDGDIIGRLAETLCVPPLALAVLVPGAAVLPRAPR